MKRMLINAQIPEELRIVTETDGKVTTLEIENLSRQSQKSNIYKAKVVRVMASLESAFVDYGASRHGFLPFREIAAHYLEPVAEKAEGKEPGIDQRLKKGTEVIVQVVKDARGTKGAALTTFLSLAGRYTVLLPYNPETTGVSTRLPDGERGQLREMKKDLKVPDNMGYIVRTASQGTSSEALQADLTYLSGIWTELEKKAKEKPAPILLLQEGNALLRAVRDSFRDDMSEVLIDSRDAFNKVKQFISNIMPHNTDKVAYYEDSVPLFVKYKVERQIDGLFNRYVRLPSGGSIVIDHTEALIAIDVNSSQAKNSPNIENTALLTNLEAMSEIARQARLRQLSGLLVIDCIDMVENANMQKVREELEKSMAGDTARVRIGKISPFGLLEMTRQNIRPSLIQMCYDPCPSCKNLGYIRNASALCFHILRQLEMQLMTMEPGGRVQLRCSLSMGTYLLNEKRLYLQMLEERYSAHIFIMPDHSFHDNNHQLQVQSQEQARKNDVQDYEAIHDVAKRVTNKIFSDVARQQKQGATQKKNQNGAAMSFATTAPAPTTARSSSRRGERSSSSRRRRRSSSSSSSRGSATQQKKKTTWWSRVFPTGDPPTKK